MSSGPPRPLIHQHAQYISDSTTMEPYAQAIALVVRPGDVVLDVGAGTGVLGYLACQAGASRVHAIEPTEILELAREITAANGLADAVTHARALSFDVDLPERADVAIVSMLARFGVEDGILPTVLDLKARLLKADAVLVPAGVEIFTAPVDIPDWYQSQVGAWLEASDSDVSYRAAGAAAVETTTSTTVPADALLAEPASVARVRFATLDTASLRCRVRHEIRRSGIVHAVAGWSVWTFADEIASGNTPGGRNTWGQMLFPFDAPVAVDVGDVVELDLDIDQTSQLAQRWTWSVRATSGPSGAVVEYSHASPHDERTDEDGAIQADVLGLFDGRLTVREIAREVMRRHPKHFQSAGDAVRVVAALSKRWSL